MPDPRIYQPTPLGDAPAPVPSWVQYEEEEKQRLRDEEAATRADAEKTARDLFALGFGDGSDLYPTHPGAGTGGQPSTEDIQQTWSENVDPTRVAEHPDQRNDYGVDFVGGVVKAGQRVPRLNPETGEYESGEPQPHIPEPPFGKYEDLTIQGRMEHIFQGMGVAMEEDPDFADDVNLDVNKALYKRIPILGAFQQVGDDLTLAQRSQNIVDGKGTKRDYFEISKVMHNADYWENKANVGERAVGNISSVATYGVEFAMTAGTNVLVKKVGKELAEAVIKKTGFKELMKKYAKKTVQTIVGGEQGIKRAVVMGAPSAGSTLINSRGGPGNMEATEDGGYKMREQEDSAFVDSLEAVAMAQAELRIETLSLGIKFPPGIKNKFLKFFGREVSKEVAPAVRGGLKKSMAISSFFDEFGEERLTEVANAFITRDTANLGITGLQGDWQKDLGDETIALAAMQVPFGAANLARGVSKVGAPTPTKPPQLERTEIPVPSWEQDIIPAVDTLADELPTESEVEAKIDALATDNLSSRREFEAVKLPDGSTLLDSYPSKVSREQLLEERRIEKEPVPLPESPVDDVPPLAELGEAEQPSALEGQVEAPELMAEEAPIEPIKPSPVIEEEAPIEAPPVIKTEAPVEDESTPEENAVAVEQIGKIDVMRIFPGRKVTEEGDGNFDVHFEGGRWSVLLKDKINLTKKQLTAIYNDYINTGGKFRTDPMGGKDQTFQQAYPTVEDFLKDNKVIAKGTARSSTDAERDADATWDVLGTIEVARGRGTDSQIKSLAHEAVHSAHLSGLWSDKEWSVLVKAYSTPGSTIRQQSEDIANASQDDKTAWEDPGFMDRMVDWTNRMLSKIGLKELSPRAAQNMFFRSSLFNRQADTSGRVDKVPSDQAPMAVLDPDVTVAADADPDATDPGDANPFPDVIAAGETQLSIMEGILKGMGDNAKPYQKGNVTRAKNRLAQLQIETRVEEEFNRDGKTAGYKWTEDPSKYEQVSVQDRESAEERVENEITPKIPDEPIEDLDAEMDWRGKPVEDPETRIGPAVPVPPHLNRPYLDADRKPKDVIHHKDARATVAKYRTGTVEEVKAKDDAFIDEFLTGEKYVDIHTSIYAIKLSEELQLTGKIEDFEMAHAIAQRYRDINADSSRITAYGKHVGSVFDQRQSRLREAIFERDKKTLALISLKKSKDPLEAAAGAKAWDKEQDRIAAVREVVEDMGYEWTENGLREIVKNRGDQQKIVYAALYSKKGNFQRVLEINSEYTIGAMLSGTNTLFTNFISGPATAGTLAIIRRAESVANSIYNQTDITMSDYGLAKELKKLGIKEFELSQIIKDSFDNGITRWWHEYGPLEESMGINEVQQFEVSPGMPGKTGRVIRKVLGLGPMAASDQLTKTFYTTLNVRLHAAHLARVEALKYNKRNPDKEQLTDKDIKARATELLINRESPAWAAALQDALEITYQDDGGIASKGIIDLALKAKNIGKGTPTAIFGKIAEQSALLFVRTPVRMFSQIAARTPVVGTPNVFAKMIANVHNGRPTFQGVNNQIVSQIGVLGLIGLLAMDDDDPLEGWFGLSGSGVGKKMKGLEYEAVPNNAVRFGKTWVKTSRVDPLDILLSTIIDGVKSAQKGRGVGQIIEDASDSAMTSILDKSMVRSVASIIDAAKPEGRGKKGWMESYLTRYIPGLYSQAARHLDENIYDSKTDSSLDNILIKSGIKKGENIIGLWGKNAKSDSKNLFLPDTRSAEMFKGNLAFQKWNDKNVDNKHQPMEFGDEYTDEDKSKVKFDTADKPKFQRAAGLLAYKLVDAFVPKIHAEAPDEVTLELINLLRKNAKKIVVAHYEKNGDFMVTNKNYEIDKMLTTINNSSLISEKSYQYDKQPTKKGGKYEDQPADMAKFNEKKASAKRYRDWLNENWVTIHGKIRQ